MFDILLHELNSSDDIWPFGFWERWRSNSKSVIYENMLQINVTSIPSDIALR